MGFVRCHRARNDRVRPSGSDSGRLLFRRTGIVNVNVEPSPSWLFTQIRPPWSSLATFIVTRSTFATSITSLDDLVGE